MEPSQSFHDHVKELRKRLMWVFLAIGISAGIAYGLREHIIAILQEPLDAPLYFTSPAGGFNFVLKLSVVIGMFVTLPMIIFQLLRFLEPALPGRIKTAVMLRYIGASFFLALAGVCFGFFLMIPLSLHFFFGYSTPAIKPWISANEYLSFVLNHMITFALAFQIPMVFLFINRIKPLKPRKILKYQRHVIVGAFGVSIILPFTYDPISQFIVAVPIVGLYYLSIILLAITNRGREYPLESAEPTPVDEPLPESEPAHQPTPVPLASFTRPKAIDGFIQTPLATETVGVNDEVEQRSNHIPTSPKPTLYIDGISPL